MRTASRATSPIAGHRGEVPPFRNEGPVYQGVVMPGSAIEAAPPAGEGMDPGDALFRGAQHPLLRQQVRLPHRRVLQRTSPDTSVSSRSGERWARPTTCSASSSAWAASGVAVSRRPRARSGAWNACRRSGWMSESDPTRSSFLSSAEAAHEKRTALAVL